MVVLVFFPHSFTESHCNQLHYNQVVCCAFPAFYFEDLLFHWVLYFLCSWMGPWIWTRGVLSVQQSVNWGGGRSRTWRPLWPARDFVPHGSNCRRTRRTSTGIQTLMSTYTIKVMVLSWFKFATLFRKHWKCILSFSRADLKLSHTQKDLTQLSTLFCQ